MASILTDIYISIDGLEYTQLDLYKDESFTLKFSKKDVQDITKVFAPFSQDFTFPATPKNKKALGYFGNTEVEKVNLDNKFKCKIYTAGILNQTGILKLTKAKYKSNKMESFTGSFNTNLLSLKDRIGDDLISDLSSVQNLMSWKPSNVFSRLKSIGLINSIKHYIPLFSNNRVINYSGDFTDIDNVAYNPGTNLFKDKIVNVGELRPAIDVISILNLIKSKYDLTILTPLEEKDELKEAYIWCNGENFAPDRSIFAIRKPFINNGAGIGQTAVSNQAINSIKITKINSTDNVKYSIVFEGLVIGDDLSTANLTIDLVDKNTNKIVGSYDFELKNGDNQVIIVIPLFLFNSNIFEFYTYMKFSKPLTWNSTSSRVDFKYGSSFITSYYDNSLSCEDTRAYNIDLIKALPEMKVIDFLTSYFKTFNISIYDSSPNDDNLFWLTPQNVNEPLKPYSKSTLDYTMYVESGDVEKSVNSDYNYYNFKHKTSAYKSNTDFKKQFNIEYGQTFFPLVKPLKANEFKVETEFSIIPPVYINGLEKYTAYGFTADNPTVNDDGRFRYTPNTNEPTLFYNHGNEPISALGVQSSNYANQLVIGSLTSYIKSMPYCKQNNNSLSFSVLKINNVSYTNTLYKLYYSDFILRLLNINALSQTYTFNLPASEIYLNDSGATPKGFRLQNDIIVGETKFEILDASIDTTTGKSKLTLLNY